MFVKNVNNESENDENTDTDDEDTDDDDEDEQSDDENIEMEMDAEESIQPCKKQKLNSQHITIKNNKFV